MSCNDDFFVKEERMIRCDSYAKHILSGMYENVDFWTYSASKDDKVHINKNVHKILLPCEDDLRHTWIKTKLAFQTLDVIGLEYDYVFRTNLSTWINVPYLIQFVESIPEEDSDKIFSSSIRCVFNGSGPDIYSPYAVGNSMLFPKKWIDVIKESDVESFRKYDKTSGITDKDEPNSIYSVDDNAIGFICNVWAELHGIEPFSIWKNFNAPSNSVRLLIEQNKHINYIAVPFRIYSVDRNPEFIIGKRMQDIADEFLINFENTTSSELYKQTTNPQIVSFIRYNKQPGTKNEYIAVAANNAKQISKELKNFDYSPNKIVNNLKTKTENNSTISKPTKY